DVSAELLYQYGFKSAEELAASDAETVGEVDGIGPERATGILEAAREHVTRQQAAAEAAAAQAAAEPPPPPPPAGAGGGARGRRRPSAPALAAGDARRPATRFGPARP